MAELLAPDELPDLVEDPEFLALPFAERQGLLEQGIAESSKWVAENEGWTPETWKGYGEAVKSLRDEVTQGETLGEKAAWVGRTAGTVLKDSAITMGTTAADLVLPPIRPKQTGEGNLTAEVVGPGATVGQSVIQGGKKLLSTAATMGARALSDTDNELTTELDALRRDIDSGNLPFDDAAKLGTWLTERAEALEPKQSKWYQTAEDWNDDEEDTLAAYAAANNLTNPKNTALLATYMQTRDPKVWDALTQEITTGPEAAALKSEDDKLARNSALGQYLKMGLGPQGANYLTEAGDPFEVAGNLLPLLKGAKAVSKGLTVSQRLREVATGAVGEVVSEQGSLTVDNPFASWEQRQEVAKETLAGVLGLSGAGAVMGGIARGRTPGTATTPQEAVGTGPQPNIPQPAPGAGQVSIDGETYTFDPTQITADQVRTLAATGGLQEFLDQGMVRNAFAPPPTDTAPPVPAPADGGGVPGPVVAGAEPVVGAAGPTVQEAQETLGDLGNVGVQFTPPNTTGFYLPPLPRDRDGNLDLLNFLNENPINAPRKGTEGSAASEYEWRESGDFDPYFRSRIMAQGEPNMNDRAQQAFDLNFITEPTADALAAEIRNVIAKRQQQRRQGPGQARVMSAMEQAQQRFEQGQQTLRTQGQGQAIDLDEISPGDTLTIQGEQVTVADVEIDDMGRTTRALLNTPAGTVRVTPESGLRADTPAATPRRSLADINADLAAWADQTIAQGQGQMSMGLDPRLLVAYTIKGAQLIAEGFTTFARWSTEMLRRFGEAVRRYLRDAWAAARKTSETGAINLGPQITQQNTAPVSQGGANSESNLSAVLPAVESTDSFQSASERPTTGEDYNQYAPAQAEKVNKIREELKLTAQLLSEWQAVQRQLEMGGFTMSLPATPAGDFARAWQAANGVPGIDWNGRAINYVSMDRIRQELIPAMNDAMNQMRNQLVELEADLYLAEEAEGGRADRLAAKESAAEWARRTRASEFAALLDARDDEAKNASSTFVAKVWEALSQYEESFQFGRSQSQRAEDIASAVSKPGRPVTATDNGSSVRFSTPTGFLDIFDANTKRPYIRSTEAGSQGKQGGGGAQLYQAALDWIHNNGKRIKDDSGLTDINAIRRTSNFMASALRWGTTRHLKPHAKQKVKWSPTSDTRNIAALAAREMENAFIAVAEARAWRYDFTRNEFIDANGNPIDAAEFDAAVLGGNPSKSGVGVSTLQRAVITSSAIEAFQRGNTEGSLSPAEIGREARRGLDGILYFDPFGLMVAADALTRLAKMARSLPAFTQRALAEFGEWVRPHLQKIWKASMQGAEAVRRHLKGAWEAARKTSEVGAINLGARISARPPTMAEAMEDQTRESQFGERVQADERLTPGLRDAPVSTFARQIQQGALDAANAIIRDNGLDRAAALFGNDASLPMPVRIAGLMQAALQYDARAALAMIRGDANASAAADAATAAAIEAKANLETFGNEAGRNLAMYNMWVRMSPDGQLRRLEREMTKVAKQVVRSDSGADVEENIDGVNQGLQDLYDETETLLEDILQQGPTPVNLQTGAPLATSAAGQESLISRVLGGIENVARGISESVTVQRAVQAIDDVLKALSGKLFADPLLITPVGQAVLRLTRTFLLQGVKLSQAVADAIADVRTRLPIAPAQEQPLSRAVTNAVVKEIIRPILRKLAFDQNYDRREAVKDMLAIGIGVMEAGRLADAVIAKRPKLAKIAQDKVRQAVLRRLSDKPRAKSRRQKLPSVLDTLVLAAGGGFINERQFLDAWDQKHGLPKLDPADRQRLRKLAAEVNLLPEGILRQAAATKFLNEVALIKGIPATDMILAAWYANILSGLSTQGVNIWGNGLNLFFRTLTAGMASPADFSKLLKGLAAGVKPGLREAREVLRTGVLLKTLKMDDMQASSALEQMVMQGRPQNAGQWLAYLMSIGGLTRYAFRAMGAMDAVFWYSAQEGYAHLAASRNLRKAGGLKPGTPQFNAEFIRELGGDEKQFLADIDQARNELRAANAPVTVSAVNRRAWEIRQQRRSANVQEASVRWADRLVFQNQPEGVGALITEAIKMLQNRRILGVPVFVPLVPFNRIVSNLFESGLDWAGVGILRGLVGSHLTEVGNKDRRLFDMVERRERFMAGVLGMSIAGTLLAAAMAVKDMDDEEVPFMIYGFGPPDKGKRDLMPKGWRMFSMKIGRNYVSYAETPMGALLGAVGGWLDSVRYGNKENKTLVERGTLAFNSALNAFTSMGALSSLKEVVDLTTGQSSVRGMQQTALSPIPGLVPGQGLMRDVAIVFDDTKISNAEVFGALVKDIPVLKSYGRPALNVLGEPTKVEGLPVVRRFANGQRPDDNIAFIQKHKLRISALPATIEIGRYLPKREAGALGLDESDQRRALGMVALENGVMTPEQQYQFTQRQGALIKESLKRLRTEFQAPPSPEMTTLLQKRLQAATEAARQTAMRELVAELR